MVKKPNVQRKMCIGIFFVVTFALLAAPALSVASPSASGGGWFCSNDEKNNFGFTVESETPPKGSLEYHGRDYRVNVKSYEINSVVISDGWVVFEGMAKVDVGYGWEDAYFYVEAYDGGEPSYLDSFRIYVLPVSGVAYSSEGVLDGGNIQVRPSSDGVIA